MAWLARCAFVALSLLTIALGSPVHAQSYPSKNVNLIVSIGPGTGMDVLARLYAEKLAAVLGKPVVVENKPGAATMIAAAQIATSPPDGHTLGVLTSSALAINQHLYKQMNYSPDNDFTPISLYVKSPLILVVNPNSPAKTVPEFIALAKKSNPPLTYASLGAGVFQHIAMELAKQRFGFDATHVPYKATGQSVTDLVAGHVATGFVEAGASIPGDQGGQASRACGFVHDPVAAAARGAAVCAGLRRVRFRGGVLACLAGACEDAEGDRRSVARRDEKDHDRSRDDEAGGRHRPDPDRVALGRGHQRLH